MEIISWRWFTGGTGTVGVAQCLDPYEEGFVYFVGVAAGIIEQADIQHIARWGARFPSDVGDLLFSA